MKIARIIGRNSKLSLLQMELVKQKLLEKFPDLQVQLLPRSSKGDELQQVPLHTVEGSDFFTRAIFEALENQEADIAVHSLKDMSGEHFFGSNHFAVVDRSDTRDIVIFHPSIHEKLLLGATLTIGTCSPRREAMALDFLQKALPQYGAFSIKAVPIRGNVDSRLKKLRTGEYDGIILATAGLIRLMSSADTASAIKELLNNCPLMVLPLIECVPAPCQGAIVAEAHPDNLEAVKWLDAIDQPQLTADCTIEKKWALEFGSGCIQKFGVTTLPFQENTKAYYAAGTDAIGQEFSSWNYPNPNIHPSTKIFSSTDYMARFFEYKFHSENLDFEEPIAFVANHKSIHNKKFITLLQKKKTWTSGTRSWLELAKKGIWVEGCADSLGMEKLKTLWSSPLFNYAPSDFRIITHKRAASNWHSKGWKTCCSHELMGVLNLNLVEELKKSAAAFWTSIGQYHLYKNYLPQPFLHLCPSGETAQQLKAEGIQPIEFPNIKAFASWRKNLKD